MVYYVLKIRREPYHADVCKISLPLFFPYACLSFLGPFVTIEDLSVNLKLPIRVMFNDHNMVT